MTRDEVIAMFSDPKDRLSFYKTALEFYVELEKKYKENGHALCGYFCYRLYELDHPIMNEIRSKGEIDVSDFFDVSGDGVLSIKDAFPEIKEPKKKFKPAVWFQGEDYDSRIKILQNAITKVKTKI